MLTKKQQKVLNLAKAGGTDSQLVILDEISALEDKFDETVKELKTEFQDKVEEVKTYNPDLNKVLESIKGQDGKDSTIPGPKGDDGYTPVKGKDYFDGENGGDGTNGKDGYTPKKGVDYFDGKDGESISGPPGVPGKDGSPDTGEQIVNKVNDLPIEPELQIEKEHIKGLKEEFEEIRRLPRGGGGGGKTKILIKDLSSDLNGVLKTFTIGTHYGIIGVWGSS